jgi:hypothetical protein
MNNIKNFNLMVENASNNLIYLESNINKNKDLAENDLSSIETVVSSTGSDIIEIISSIKNVFKTETWSSFWIDHYIWNDMANLWTALTKLSVNLCLEWEFSKDCKERFQSVSRDARLKLEVFSKIMWYNNKEDFNNFCVESASNDRMINFSTWKLLYAYNANKVPA